ncbi:MAG TPA: hypothetical protein VG323_15310 [Thermoanaerobaculia bacterium]|nr:hypothetical protein [Thermoanaerobaculia bacterium]
MRRILFAPILILGLTACVAVVDLAPQHEPFVQLSQIRPTWNDVAPYGPVAVTYELTIFNPSERTLFVRGVDLHSSGQGWIHIAHQTRRLSLAVPPHESASALVRVSAWANGGEASAYAPVTIHGTLRYGRGQTYVFATTP